MSTYKPRTSSKKHLGTSLQLDKMLGVTWLILVSPLLISAVHLQDKSEHGTKCCSHHPPESPKNATSLTREHEVSRSPLYLSHFRDATRPDRVRRSSQPSLDTLSHALEQRADYRATLSEKLNPNFWPARGRRSQVKSLREMTQETPFWASRGRRMAFEPDSSEENPFWAARGKKLLFDSLESKPFWASRGKKLIESGEEPFWAARGKKYEDFLNSIENPFWAARGKKYEDFLNSIENPFWAARGKKYEEFLEDNNQLWGSRGKKLEDTLEDENPFWAARGKKYADYLTSLENSIWDAKNKKLENTVEDENPFWAARGKKETISNINPLFTTKGSKLLHSLNTPFYVTRAQRDLSSSKENPFWASRGRRSSIYSILNNKRSSAEVPPFWAARGKRDEATDLDKTMEELENVVKPRSNREQGGTDPFWPTRGKRPNSAKLTKALGLDQFWASRGKKNEEYNKEDEEFWQKLENKTSNLNKRAQDNNIANNDTDLQEILSAIFGVPVQNKSKKQTKPQQLRELIVNPWYSTDFWAARG